MTLKQTTSRTGAAEIATQIRQAIMEGTYQFQDRLPPERDLAEDFGTARGTIRQALKRLEDMDLVRRKVGSGTYVNYIAHPDHEEIAEATSPLELIDVRIAIEPNIARLAVLNANARNLKHLHDAMSSLDKCGGDANEFSKADEVFHLRLAQCAQNPLLEWIYQLVNNVRGHHQWDARKDKILTPENMAQYNAQHRAIYYAIERRDPTKAVQFITEHLLKAKSELIGQTTDIGG